MTRQKTALITGASSGIGYATAIEFAKRGYKVYACARRLGPMEPLKEHGIHVFTLDVTSLESVQNAHKYLIEQGVEYLDILFNNAGQSCVFPAIDLSDEAMQRCFDVNVFGSMRVTRELAPLVINAKGAIGFTGSISGIVPFPWSCAYSASKAAIHQYAATLRLEMKPFGVRVVNIVTGGVKTAIQDSRPLPAGSLYELPEMADAFKLRQTMARDNNPMPAEKYAYRVANDFEGVTTWGRLDFYRGAKASLLTWVMLLLPRFVVEWGLIRKFRLGPVFAAIAKKLKAKND